MCFVELDEFWRKQSAEEARRLRLELEYRRSAERPAMEEEAPLEQPEPASG